MKTADRRRGVRILTAFLPSRFPGVDPRLPRGRAFWLPGTLTALAACAALFAVGRMVVAAGTVTVYVDDNSTDRKSVV